MRIHIKLMLLIIVLVLLVSGCQEQSKQNENTTAKQDIKFIVVKSVQSDPRTNEFPTKLNEFSSDLDLDNEEEKIELYTAAGHGPDGKMLWDDGQKWLLVVIDDKKYYSLYSDYLQQGQVYFNLLKVSEQMIPQVNVVITTQLGLEVIDFNYNENKEQFEGEVVYRPIDKFLYYTSIPSY